MHDEPQATVVQSIREEMARRRWNPSDLADAANVSRDTIDDFLGGRRWPRSATLAKVEHALDWAPGDIAAVLAGGPPIGSTVGAAVQDADDVLLHLPPGTFEGLSDIEREEAVQAARLTVLRTAREIRDRQ